jgi:hypothetical protein
MSVLTIRQNLNLRMMKTKENKKNRQRSLFRNENQESQLLEKDFYKKFNLIFQELNLNWHY